MFLLFDFFNGFDTVKMHLLPLVGLVNDIFTWAKAVKKQNLGKTGFTGFKQ